MLYESINKITINKVIIIIITMKYKIEDYKISAVKYYINEVCKIL